MNKASVLKAIAVLEANGQFDEVETGNVKSMINKLTKGTVMMTNGKRVITVPQAKVTQWASYGYKSMEQMYEKYS